MKFLLVPSSMAALCLTGCVVPTGGSSASDRAGIESHASQIAAIETGLRRTYGVSNGQNEIWSLEERMRHYKVPGVSIAVAIDGKLAWAKAYGISDTASGRPVDTETLFQAASLSKPVASLAGLKLVEQGSLSLDAPVNDVLIRWKIPDSEYSRATPVTLRHLMSHRAGTTVHGFKGYKVDEAIPSLVQILNGEAPANTAPVIVSQPPGRSYRYSGGGYTILQLAIEDAARKNFADVVAENVFRPAGMKRSTFRHPTEDTNIAVGHAGKNSDPIEAPGLRYPELAAAGLWTTPTELVRLGINVAKARNDGDAFLDRQLAQQLVPKSADDPGLGFGLNDSGDGIAFVHNGHNPGFSARWINYADGRASVAILTNSDSGGDLIREIFSAIGYVYGWRQDAFVERDIVDLSPEWTRAVAGDYGFSADDPEAAATISIIDDMLWIEGAIAERARFYPVSRTEFFIPKGLNFKVETDDAGAPVALDVEGEIRLLKLPTKK